MPVSSHDSYAVGEICDYNDPADGWIMAEVKVERGEDYSVEVLTRKEEDDSSDAQTFVSVETVRKNLRKRKFPAMLNVAFGPPDPPLPRTPEVLAWEAEGRRLEAEHRNLSFFARDDAQLRDAPPAPTRLTGVPARIEHAIFGGTVQELFWHFDLDNSQNLDLAEFKRLVKVLMEIRDRRKPSDTLANATAESIAESFLSMASNPNGVERLVVDRRLLTRNARAEGPFNSLLLHADLEARISGMTLVFAVKSLGNRRDMRDAVAGSHPGGGGGSLGEGGGFSGGGGPSSGEGEPSFSFSKNLSSAAASSSTASSACLNRAAASSSNSAGRSFKEEEDDIIDEYCRSTSSTISSRVVASPPR